MKTEIEQITELLDTMREPVAAVREGVICCANAAARALFAGELIGEEASDIFDPLLLEGPGPAAGTVQLDGETLPVAASSLGSFRILSIRPESASWQDEAAAMRSIGLALKNELAITSTAQSLIQGQMQAKADLKSMQYLAMLDKSLHSMSRIADNCVRLFEDYTALNESELDLVFLIENVVATTQYLMAVRGVSLTFQSPLQKLLYYGDGAKLERMLLNLLSNSLKAVSGGGSITVSLRENNAGVFITVQDDGPGIPPEKLSGLFGKYREDRDLTEAAGAGFGLGIVQQTARLHGGNVVIESHPGQGATATVFLPHRDSPANVLHSPTWSYQNPLTIFLTELADVLDFSTFMNKEK